MKPKTNHECKWSDQFDPQKTDQFEYQKQNETRVSVKHKSAIVWSIQFHYIQKSE